MPATPISTATTAVPARWHARCAGPTRAVLVPRALCWSHARRKFFELADIRGKVRENKPAHDIERDINGLSAEGRHAAR